MVMLRQTWTACGTDSIGTSLQVHPGQVPPERGGGVERDREVGKWGQSGVVSRIVVHKSIHLASLGKQRKLPGASRRHLKANVVWREL